MRHPVADDSIMGQDIANSSPTLPGAYFVNFISLIWFSQLPYNSISHGSRRDKKIPLLIYRIEIFFQKSTPI
jgi:hypothetical protein